MIWIPAQRDYTNLGSRWDPLDRVCGQRGLEPWISDEERPERFPSTAAVAIACENAGPTGAPTH